MFNIYVQIFQPYYSLFIVITVKLCIEKKTKKKIFDVNMAVKCPYQHETDKFVSMFWDI